MVDSEEVKLPASVASPMSPMSHSQPKPILSISPTQSPASSPPYSNRQRFIPPSTPSSSQRCVPETNELNGASSTDDSSAFSASQAVLLGIQTLERQQEELERKRQTLNRNVPRANPFDSIYGDGSNMDNRPQDHSGVPMTVHVTGAADDELTTGSVSLDKPQPLKKHNRINSISKMLKTPLKPIRRTISDRFSIDPTPTTSTTTTRSVSESRMKPILYGYLHKLGRNNQWQKRWFESDGTSLKYFKSKKKEKCLATLDLFRVGKIMMDRSDSSGCTFTVEVAGRQYYLCADTKDRSMDWVITLNRVKEARMQIGGLKLIDPDFAPGTGAKQSKSRNRNKSDSDEDNVAARVVMNTSRPRTKGLGKDDFSDMEKSLEEDEVNIANPMSLPHTMSPSGSASLASTSPYRYPQANNLFAGPANIQHMHDQVAVRWTKQRSAVQNWARRLSRWAKRMTMVRCVVHSDVVHLNSQFQYQLEGHDMDEGNSEDEQDKEEPFIDLDVARYSNCPESYVEGQFTSNSGGYADEISTFGSCQPSLQQSSSWKVQKNDPSVSESSIQSSAGRISPSLADDDASGIIA